VSTRSLRWILTGPIGSGKSTVGDLLRERGITVIDADRLGHAVLEPGGDAFEQVAARWPECAQEGRIDRRRLGEIVFADPDQLRDLESLTHPHIVRRIEELSAENDGRIMIVELPILDGLSLGWEKIVVDAPVEVRRSRLRDRGMSPDEISDRMRAQPSREAWLREADLVIDNSGSLGDLEAQVEKLIPVLLPGCCGDDPEEG